MKNDLQQFPFFLFFRKRPSMDFSEMLAKAKKYTCAKEGYGVHVLSIIPSIPMTCGIHVPPVDLTTSTPSPPSASSFILMPKG